MHKDQKDLGDFGTDLPNPEDKERFNEIKLKYNRPRLNYPRNWENYNNSQTKEKTFFLEFLCELIDSVKIKNYKPKQFGRKPYSIRDLLKCSAIKVFSNLSARRVIGELKLLKESDFINEVPSFNTLCSFMKESFTKEILNDLILMATLPLKDIETDWAVDSTGFSNKKFVPWISVRSHRFKKRDWAKLHAICGIKTKIIPVLFIAQGYSGDSPYFIKLVNKIKPYFQVLEVSADRAYCSRENYSFVDSCGGTAYIQFKKNTTGRSYSHPIWKKMYNLAKEHADFFDERYHKRSNIESCFSAIKRKYLDYTRAKTFEGQEIEILYKILCHNICCLIRANYEYKIFGDLYP